jgi:hypothetical protein
MKKFAFPTHHEIEPEHLGHEPNNKLLAQEDGHDIEIRWTNAAENVQATIDGKSVTAKKAQELYDRHVQNLPTNTNETPPEPLEDDEEDKDGGLEKSGATEYEDPEDDDQ